MESKFPQRLLAAFGSQRDRYGSAEEVQKHSGIAPVMEKSGKNDHNEGYGFHLNEQGYLPQGMNYEKHPPLRQSTYQWRFGRTKYGVVLILRDPDGKDTVYARETGTGLLSR